MYGPTKGDMQFILTLAGIGVIATVFAVGFGLFWLVTHVSIAFQ